MKKAAKAVVRTQRGFCVRQNLGQSSTDHSDDSVSEVLQTAVDCGFFPLYEVERGKTVITYDPEAVGRKRPIKDWLGEMGKTKHLMAPESDEMVAVFSEEVERRWKRLKAKHDNPEL
jgi:pyruvate ferredoxin oxidoreductase alpha subunit